MSIVYEDILNAVKGLLDGSGGSDSSSRTVDRGLFTFVDSLEQLGLNKTVSKPYPFCFQFKEVKDEGFKGDLGVGVADTYQYMQRMVPIYVLYAPSENKSFDVYKTGQNNYQIIKQCLEDPLNLAETSNWVNCNVSSGEVVSVEINGGIQCDALRVELEITYREVLS